MSKKGKTKKNQLKERWQETYDSLTKLTDLHVWPLGLDIAQLEGALLTELDSIERELSQKLQ